MNLAVKYIIYVYVHVHTYIFFTFFFYFYFFYPTGKAACQLPFPFPSPTRLATNKVMRKINTDQEDYKYKIQKASIITTSPLPLVCYDAKNEPGIKYTNVP